MNIELQIFHNTEETAQLDQLDLPVDIEDCKLIPYTFYHIDAIVQYKGNNKYTMIYSSGDTFITNVNYEKLKEMIYHKTDDI